MLRRFAIVLLVMLAGCSTTEPAAPTTTAPTTTAAVTKTTTSLAPTTTTTVGQPDPQAALDAFLANLSAGSIDEAFDAMAPDAVWSFGLLELMIEEALPAELAWLGGIFELPPDATGRDVLEALLTIDHRLGATWQTSGCEVVATTVSCEYVKTTLLDEIVGMPESGTVSATVSDAGLARVEAVSAEPGPPTADVTAFLRWARIRRPEVRLGPVTLGQADALATAVPEWIAAGRPDVDSPAAGAEPVDVVTAYVTARNDGDWETHTALLGDGALFEDFGSWEEFQAAQLLDRDILIRSCEVTLASGTETTLACDVTVSDIIVDTAGIEPDNPNATTFRVSDGRVVRLPEFLPSSFLAETAIEEWAQAAQPDAYATACPNGIAGQSVIDGLPCATFIAEHQDEWTPAVEAVSSG